MARWGGSASKLNSVKTIRQFASFILGITVGVCLYSLLRFLPPSARRANSPAQVAENRPNHALTPPWVQRSTQTQLTTPATVPTVGISPSTAPRAVGIQLPSWPQPHTAPHDDVTRKLNVSKEFASQKSTQMIASKPSTEAPIQSRRVSVAPQTASVPRVAESNSITPLLPSPTLFKAIGYVEKSDGQLEAIILQENQIQVVHLGDEIAGRYRVTKITPEMVGAVDETMLTIPITESGDVIKADASATSDASTITAAGAPASSPRDGTITPQEQVQWASALPQALPASRTEAEQPLSSDKVIESTSNSLGYVQKYDGRVEAVVADGDSVRLVPQTQTETMAQAAPAGGIPAPDATGFKFSATVASSALGAVTSPTMGAAGQDDEPIFRHETRRDLSANAGGATLGNLKFAQESVSSVSEIGATQRKSAFSGASSGSATSFSSIPFEMKPLGFVVKADGEVAAILEQDDDVSVVWQGDRFAGHLRAIRVIAESVEAIADTPHRERPLPFASAMNMPELSSISAPQGHSLVSAASCLVCDSATHEQVPEGTGRNVSLGLESSTQKPSAEGIQPVTEHGQDGRGTRRAKPASSSATFIFQTLGYVQFQDGGMQAIVADGSETYLVRQGEVFAGQYQVTSVDPLLVLAVKVLPARPVPDFLSAETDFGGEPASKTLDGSLQQALSSGGMGLLLTASMQQDGHAAGTNLGVNLFTTLSTGLDMHSHSYTTDNPKLGY